jgi:hypothetical protein
MTYARKRFEDALPVDGTGVGTVKSGETTVVDETKIEQLLGEYDDCKDAGNEEWELVDSISKCWRVSQERSLPFNVEVKLLSVAEVVEGQATHESVRTPSMALTLR